jgi:hypothetical protein
VWNVTLRAFVAVVFACGLGACGASATSVDGPDAGVNAGVDAAIAPPCPLDGGVDHGDYAECGGGCTVLHEQGVCSPGYVCTCTGVCAWWEHFPQDAGSGCGFAPDAGADASLLDASTFGAR